MEATGATQAETEAATRRKTRQRTKTRRRDPWALSRCPSRNRGGTRASSARVAATETPVGEKGRGNSREGREEERARGLGNKDNKGETEGRRRDSKVRNRDKERSKRHSKRRNRAGGHSRRSSRLGR